MMIRTNDEVKVSLERDRRRMLRVAVRPEVLAKMMEEGAAYRVAKGFPASAVVVGTYFIADEGLFYVYLQDESFPIVPEGRMTTVFVAELERITL